jgi:ubiquinone/menaquinone biosynthesis C-methylase UbiE
MSVDPGVDAIDPAIRRYYDRDREDGRLSRSGGGQLERARTQELLQRFLPAPPSDVLDVGGGTGVYADWLADLGYRVHLVDPMALHVERAQARAAARTTNPFTASVGDARSLDAPDAAVDAVLYLGPLYHLTERDDRLLALREARRVLRPGGTLCAVAISRFASLLDGLERGWLEDPEFRGIVERDLAEGQHRNPGGLDRPGWFTTAYFHRPEDLAAEIAEAGFGTPMLLGIEGPALWFPSAWNDPAQRERTLFAARATEREPSLLGMNAHILAVATV